MHSFHSYAVQEYQRLDRMIHHEEYKWQTLKELNRLEGVVKLKLGLADARDMVGQDCTCTSWRQSEVEEVMGNLCYHNSSANSLSNLIHCHAHLMVVVLAEGGSSFHHEQPRYEVVEEVVVWATYELPQHVV